MRSLVLRAPGAARAEEPAKRGRCLADFLIYHNRGSAETSSMPDSVLARRRSGSRRRRLHACLRRRAACTLSQPAALDRESARRIGDPRAHHARFRMRGRCMRWGVTSARCQSLKPCDTHPTNALAQPAGPEARRSKRSQLPVWNVAMRLRAAGSRGRIRRQPWPLLSCESALLSLSQPAPRYQRRCWGPRPFQPIDHIGVKRALGEGNRKDRGACFLLEHRMNSAR